MIEKPMQTRTQPYIWPSLLAQYMTGQKQCLWAAWMRAHYKDVPTLPRGYVESDWQTRHTKLLHEIKDSLPDATLFVEQQNKFFLNGAVATLGGNADLVVQTEEKRGVVYDAKAGKQKDSDTVQVLLYMYALPRGVERYRGWTFDGEVYYGQHDQRWIPSEQLTTEFIDRMSAMIKRLADEIEPARTPSRYECRYCEIADCPERFTTEYASVTTDF